MTAQIISQDPIWNQILTVLLDDSISELQVNSPTSIFVKQNGRRLQMGIAFDSEEDYLRSIEVGLVPLVSSHTPYSVNGSLFEGPLRYSFGDKKIQARCTIVLSPTAEYPAINLAKKSTTLSNLDEIANRGSMAPEILGFIKAAAAADLTIVFSGGSGAGKALHKDTLIPTPTGLRTLGSLNVGDRVFDETGKRATILKKYCPHDPVSYEFTFSTGDRIKSSAGHLWSVIDLKSGDTKIVTSQEIFESEKNRERKNKAYAISRLNHPVRYAKKKLPVPPYTLGLWITDEYLFRRLAEKIVGNQDFSSASILSEYKTASQKQRLDFISGLVEVGGVFLKDGAVRLQTYDLGVVEAAREISASMGWRVRPIQTACSSLFSAILSGKPRRTSYAFEFFPEGLKLRSRGKTALFNQSLKNRVEEPISFTKMKKIVSPPEDYFCIEVDSPSSLFLAGKTFIPTHNTTFLEAFTKELGMSTRIGVAEDVPELNLLQKNTVYLRSVPKRAGMSEADVVTLEWVVAQFNRMRADKIIIGETRGKEFADFLVAANSGMAGSLTTIHAEDPKRALEKMSSFSLKGNPSQPLRSINRDIANSIDLIIQLSYFKSDSRYRVTAIEEISNVIGSNDEAAISTNRLYTYHADSDTWVKEANPTDSLRNKFKMSGVSTDSFSRTQPGTILYPSGETNTGETQQPQQQRTGLPTRREN